MAHYVNCQICKERFDRDVHDAVKVSKARYAHRSCAELHPEIKVYDAAPLKTEERLEKTNKQMILNKEDEKISVNIGTGSTTVKSKQKSKEKEDEDFAMLRGTMYNIFGDYCNWVVAIKQAKSYKQRYGYTYSGMARTLIYYYEKLGNDPYKSNGTLGIIPYVYDKAYEYYYNVWLRQQKNIDNNLKYKHLSTEETKTINIIIPKSEPIRTEMRKPRFNFLEEDFIEED